MFPKFTQSRILIHIAFHYVEPRFCYLVKVLSAINSYHFKHIDVIIDTNSAETKSCFRKLQSNFNFDFHVQVHDPLEHPFLLTWAHRHNISDQIDKYDYFMYIEDDIEIHYDALTRWRDDSHSMHEDGYLRGFMRTEINSRNNTVLTDQKSVMKFRNLQYYKNKPYLRPSNPYHGFWIYSQQQMKIFIKSQCWLDGNYPKWGVRERAAAGMTWLDTSSHNILIPLTNALEIPEDVRVHHLPNNYARNPDSKHGSVSIHEFTSPKLMMKMYSVFLKLQEKFTLLRQD